MGGINLYNYTANNHEPHIVTTIFHHLDTQLALRLHRVANYHGASQVEMRQELRYRDDLVVLVIDA